MPNELPLGTRRAGNLVDFDPRTPTVHVTLERSDQGICVRVPWSAPDSPYASWFDTGLAPWRDPEDRAERLVPRRLLFQDSHGSVTLIGCRARGFHADYSGPGSGTVWASAAILGVDDDVEYDEPHGLQTAISGMREWLGVTSWDQELEWDGAGRSVTIRSLRVPAIEVGAFDGVGLSLAPTWHMAFEDERDRRVLNDSVHCRTRAAVPVGWETHMERHLAVRDLLALSRWRPESCFELSVVHDDDVITTSDGTTHPAPWRRVVVPHDTPAAPPSGYRPHLIEFADLGAGGIARWIGLRDSFSRALDPLLSTVDLDASPQTLLAQTGPGMEALGYLLMLRDGTGPKKAADASLHLRLARVADDLGHTLPVDRDRWISATASTYNALKHANRRVPDPVDILNVWRECILVIRAWVALELGVARDDIASRLEHDPLRHEYVRVT